MRVWMVVALVLALAVGGAAGLTKKERRKMCTQQKRECLRQPLVVPTTTSTSTTAAPPLVTTTTVPGTFLMNVRDALLVPATGALWVEVTVWAYDNEPRDLAREHFRVTTGLSGSYPAVGPGVTNACNATRIVQRDGEVTCTLNFAVPGSARDFVVHFEHTGYEANDSFTVD